MLRETPDDRRVAAPGLHCMTIVVVWKRFVKKLNILRILYLQFFLNEIAVFFGILSGFILLSADPSA